jgi:hypothetical protein
MAKAKKKTKQSKIKKETSPSKAEQSTNKEVRTERIRNRQMGRKS